MEAACFINEEDKTTTAHKQSFRFCREFIRGRRESWVLAGVDSFSPSNVLAEAIVKVIKTAGLNFHAFFVLFLYYSEKGEQTKNKNVYSSIFTHFNYLFVI